MYILHLALKKYKEQYFLSKVHVQFQVNRPTDKRTNYTYIIQLCQYSFQVHIASTILTDWLS